MEQETTNPPPLFSPTLTDYGSNSIKKQKLINEKKELDEQCIIQNANAKNPKFKEPPGCFPEKVFIFHFNMDCLPLICSLLLYILP